MLEKKIFIPVQARPDAPQTTLHIRIVSQDSHPTQKKPYVFMLPGGPGANHSHYKDYECLHTAANIVFIDPRGCGLSDRNDPTSYTMQNYIQDVEVIRQYLQLEQIILLGKSYGAMCALGYALDYPQCVSSLILAAGSPSFHNLETAKRNVEIRGTPVQKAVCEKLWAGSFISDEDVDDFFNKMAGMYSWKTRHQEPTNRPEPDYIFTHEPLNQGFRKFLRDFDYRNRLSEVLCDTLILVGKEDWVTSLEHSEFMAKHIPNNQLIVFPNADHSMEADVPEAFFSSIQAFLKNQYAKKQALENPVLSKQYNPVPMP